MKTLAFGLIAILTLVNSVFAVDPPPDGGYPNQNTAEGDSSLFSLTTGAENTAVGFSSLFQNTEGTQNTAIGAYALTSNTTGSVDTAVGSFALNSNTSGAANTAMGPSSLYFNTTGSFNTAIGYSTLSYNTTGNNNTAVGNVALISNTTGVANIAIGGSALQENTVGNNNTASGTGALTANTTGSDNTAVGYTALPANTTGMQNTACGMESLNQNLTGNQNTAVGSSALAGNQSGSFNVALGPSAGVRIQTGSNNIDIGNPGGPSASESNVIRIGTKMTHKSTFIAGISGATVAGGVGVVIDTNGHLGTVTSSARYKKNIQPMNDVSDKILALHPVTFQYKKELDPKAIPQFGLLAEDVAKVDPDLVARDDDGKPYTVRYEAVNAMLLNEFLKEHKKVEEQASQLSNQTKEIAELKNALENMSARLDANGL